MSFPLLPFINVIFPGLPDQALPLSPVVLPAHPVNDLVGWVNIKPLSLILEASCGDIL